MPNGCETFIVLRVNSKFGISIQIKNLDKMSDPLFSVRNNFYLGAFNTVLNEAADVENVSELEAIERDTFIYRSYIALGSYEVWHQIHAWKKRNVMTSF